MSGPFIYAKSDIKSKTMAQSSPLFLNVSKKILARQSIFRNIDCNIAHQLKKVPPFLSDQQIKTSVIYAKLSQRVEKAKRNQEQQIQDFNKSMAYMKSQIQSLKGQTQQNKVQMWQLKNQIMQLQEMLAEQAQEYNELYNQMQNQQQEEQGYDQENDQDQQQYSRGILSQTLQGENYEDQSSYQAQSNQQSEQIQSKPSCSIKYFISNRSITQPDLSQQGLQIGQGIDMQSEAGNSSYTQLYVKGQSKDQVTEEEYQYFGASRTQGNMVSFKKTDQHIFMES